MGILNIILYISSFITELACSTMLFSMFFLTSFNWIVGTTDKSWNGFFIVFQDDEAETLGVKEFAQGHIPNLPHPDKTESKILLWLDLDFESGSRGLVQIC